MLHCPERLQPLLGSHWLGRTCAVFRDHNSMFYAPSWSVIVAILGHDKLTNCSTWSPSSSSSVMCFWLVASRMSCFRAALRLDVSPDLSRTFGPLISSLRRADNCLNRSSCEAIFGPVTMNPVGSNAVLQTSQLRSLKKGQRTHSV